MRKEIIILLLLGLSSGSTEVAPIVARGSFGPRQVADGGFDTHIVRPAYVKQHPRVLFDEAHNNLYTSTGRYKPFADLIRSDGYKLEPGAETFTRKQIEGYDVLVIVDASGPKEQRDTPAFTEAECDAVRDWVKAGGALLLITDHAPFGSAAAPLARRFDVGVTAGFTFDTKQYNKESGDQTELVFARDDGLVGEHPITRGRDETERINRVMTFSGTSLKGPGGSVALLKLADTAKDVLPPDRKPSSPDQPADHRTVSASGRAQAIALEFGKGRVVVLSEAPMLTAQVMPSGFRFGMNIAGTDNRQLALNIMHWLSGLLK
jgi:hypothetical protein